MKKQIIEELNDIKYLFNYSIGKVISEQEQFESEDSDFEEIDIDDEDDEDDENNDINYLKSEFSEEYGYEDMDTGEDFAPSFDSDGNFLGMVKPNQDDMEVDEDLIENRELEVPVKPGTKTPTKPKKPGTPYRPKPGPKKNPKARKGDIPDWLSFDELGIDFE
jgi:hypothetical protein